jgi:glycosyltransferase involved in cell wall biosynthesis
VTLRSGSPAAESARNPLVSFVLYAYNQERFIREAIQGAFAQTYEPLEIILSDDCSTDRTFEIMREIASSYRGNHLVKLRRNERNLGIGGHINAVVAAASAEIIALADGDDISLPERVSLLVKPLIEDANVIGTHSAVNEIDLEGRDIGQSERQKLGKRVSLDTMFDEEICICTQTHLFRKKVFQVFGPLNSDLTNEGLPMTFREFCLGAVRYIDQPTVLYRRGSGISTSSGDFDKDQLKYMSWRSTAWNQIVCDINRIGFANKKLVKKAVQRQRYYKELYHINAQPFELLSIFRLCWHGLIDVEVIKMFLRRNSPRIVRNLYFKYRYGPPGVILNAHQNEYS